MENKQDRVYIFADGPNVSCAGARKNNNRVEWRKFKEFIASTYGTVRKFLWYAVEPRIDSIDFERVNTRSLEKLLNGGSGIAKKIREVDPESQQQLICELADFYESMKRTKEVYERSMGFLRYISNGTEVVSAVGATFRNTKRCDECGEDVTFVGKTEKGMTDFNLAVDLVYHAAQNDYDTAVVVSGDSHMLRPVFYAKNMGKKVVVSSYKDSISMELLRLADEFIDLGNQDFASEMIKSERRSE